MKPTRTYNVTLPLNGIEAESTVEAVETFLLSLGIDRVDFPFGTQVEVTDVATGRMVPHNVGGEDDPDDECSECGAPTNYPDDPHAGYGMCASCLHDALRSGWTPGEDQ